MYKQTHTVGKTEYPPMNVVKQVACHFFCHKYLQQFFLAISMFHAFSNLLKPKCLWHIAAAICQSVYLFVVLSWAFAPESSVRSPGLE